MSREGPSGLARSGIPAPRQEEGDDVLAVIEESVTTCRGRDAELLDTGLRDTIHAAAKARVASWFLLPVGRPAEAGRRPAPSEVCTPSGLPE
jgi:hypothetical protein